VREAGSPSRLGRVLQVYPYTLAALEQAMTDARFRSHQGKTGRRADGAPSDYQVPAS
jgi:hypothetical protein